MPRALRWLAIAVTVFFVLGGAACSDSDSSSDPPATAYNVAGFSDHQGPNNGAPPDVTPAGGTLRVCDPSSLFAFVNFSNLTPPKEFVGVWTLNGVQINRQVFPQDRTSGQSFFRVQNSPVPLTPGTYRFELQVEGKAATNGSFTLSC